MPRLELNQAIQTQKNEKVYCQESYTLELYKLYNGSQTIIPKGGKDIEKDQLLQITGISSITDNEIYFEVNNMTAVPVELNKEKYFFEFHGLTKLSFAKWLKTPEGRKQFIEEKNLLYIVNSFPNLRGSLLGGFQRKLCEEFHAQIKNPTAAYNAKIISKNQGGFIVDVFGMSAFLPGGLAAANKILDFDKYIGKTVPVMVEDYLSDIDTFIMSNKKYVQHMLPTLADEFDTTVPHIGIVTGCIKYGIFIEFGDVFTGLLHTSKMLPEIKKKFEENRFVPGDEIECWVREIGKDYKLVLTNFEPGTEEDSLKVGEIYEAKITAIKDFGMFIKLKSGEIGLISSSYFKNPEDYVQGADLKVKLKSIKGDKFYFEFA
jgi:predicted RNA-binding protein with RPS1 domain